MRRLAVLLALCACAATARPPTADTTGDLPALARELEQAERDLEGPQALGTQADCSRACPLERRICELADRICGIAGRHPDDADARERCNDGRARCARAHTRVAQQCTCPDRP